MILHHALDVEFLDSDDAEPIDDAPSVLVAEVVPPVSDALMDARDNLAGFLSFTRAALLFCKFTLCFGESLFLFAEEARVLDEFAIGQSGEGFQPHVNADFLTGGPQDFGPDLAGEAGVPLVTHTADGTRLNVAVNRAVQSNGEVAYLGEPQAALAEPEAALRVGDAVILPMTFNAWETWCFSRLDPAEEGVEGQVNADGDLPCTS
jgi:hypothetical protein